MALPKSPKRRSLGRLPRLISTPLLENSELMTTKRDHSKTPPNMLHCPLRPTSLYPTLVLALRDMRAAHGRDEVTGAGEGTPSWIGLTLGMVVLDTLTGDTMDVGKRWKQLLARHGITKDDACLIYALRNSMLHGYGLPSTQRIGGRKVLLTSRLQGFAIETSQPDTADVSVPLFCSLLVERIAAEAPDDWDVTSIDVAHGYF